MDVREGAFGRRHGQACPKTRTEGGRKTFPKKEREREFLPFSQAVFTLQDMTLSFTDAPVQKALAIPYSLHMK